MLMQQQCDCLYYRVDKDMLGDGGGEMGPLPGIMIITTTHRTADCTHRDRAGAGLCHPMLTGTVHVGMSALCSSV